MIDFSFETAAIAISVMTGFGGLVATVFFVTRDKVRGRTIVSQGDLINTLGQEVDQLKRNDKDKTERIVFLEQETQKLRSEINGKDLLIVAALKQYFAENPEAVKKISKEFREILNV